MISYWWLVTVGFLCLVLGGLAGWWVREFFFILAEECRDSNHSLIKTLPRTASRYEK